MVSFPLLRLSLFTFALKSAVAPASAASSGCRKLSTDADWPSAEEWQEGIPGVQAQNNSDSLGPLPDYRIRATSYADVQAAVKFAAANEVRVAVVTTGHDQLGRNTAGSGLLIDVSLLQGARVSASFNATPEGVQSPLIDEIPETITPTPGVQAAVTFNPAFNGFRLQSYLDASGLFLIGGTNGKHSFSLNSPIPIWGCYAKFIQHSRCSRCRGLGSEWRVWTLQRPLWSRCGSVAGGQDSHPRW